MARPHPRSCRLPLRCRLVLSCRWAAAMAVAVALASCGDDGAGRAAIDRSSPRSEPPPEITTTAQPPGEVPTTTAGDASPSVPTCPAIPSRAEPPADRPQYTLRLDVNPVQGVVEGHLHVVFTPDVDTDRLVFRLWPNGPRSGPGGVRLQTGPAASQGRDLPAVNENPTTLVVRPPGGIPAGQPIEVAMPWRLDIPGPFNDRISRDGDSLRLGSFFPILAWEPGVGWATEPPTGGFAEASTAPTADFDVTVSLPEGYEALASGVSDRPGHWTANAMRDFAMSVGRFQKLSATVNAPDPVAVVVGVHDLPQAEAAPYLQRVVRILQFFSERFGAYPWPSYTLAITPGLGGGIEYPSYVMQGPGTVGRTTSHEVAHMWFYGLVGNNQGRDPWLDEGLATYGEARFEGTLAGLKSTVVPAGARGAVDEPMAFWEQRSGVYYEGVYLQGAQAVAALGDPDLVDCALRVYVARHAFRIARPADFVSAAAEVFPDAAAMLARFGVGT